MYNQRRSLQQYTDRRSYNSRFDPETPVFFSSYEGGTPFIRFTDLGVY